MAHQVDIDHLVIGAADFMALLEAHPPMGQLFTATREAGVWKIRANNSTEVLAETPDRAEAIDTMNSLALDMLGPSGPNGEGYVSQTSPPGLRRLP